MLRRHYIENGEGGQIHFARSGRGERILLLHQTPRSWDEYREVIDLLESEFELIAMDLPGMGASDAMRDGASIEVYAKAAAQLIENTGAPVTVCGHHTGGVVAIEIAASRPELVDRLILSSTPWIDASERKKRASKTPIDSAKRQRDGAHLQSYWSQRNPYYPEDPVYLDRFIKDALAARDASEGHRAVGAYHMEAATPSIQVPTLIVEHSADPFASRHTGELNAAFPHAAMRKIENGGVALEVTASEFAGIVATWINETRSQRADKTRQEVKA